MKLSRGRGLVLVLASLALVAGACSSSKKSGSSGGATSTTIAPKQGGDLVVSAEQEPDCMDWIGSCAGAAWGTYTVGANTMPKAYVWTSDSKYVPGDILSGPATVTTSPNQVVTYHINPNAVWSDGTPITSADFAYTWDQIANGKDIYDTTGYANISGVATPDPQTAVATFKTPFANWYQLFGGFYGVFPSHILKGQDRDAAMKNGYTWSGGPWMMDHWTKGVEIKLVPNPKYWGQKPYLNSMTFKFITDTAAETQAVKTGQVSAAYPQASPGQPALKGLPGISFDAISGLSFEALWFQNAKPPLDNQSVRQALAYATDRNAIVTTLFGPTQPGIQPIQSFATPAFGAAYTTAFSKYSQNLPMVNTLMTGAGYAKDSSGIWAKGGQEVTLELKTTSGNKRRALTAQILQSQWQGAGFKLNIVTEKAGVLFGQDGPSGNFQIALFAQTPNDGDASSAGGCVIFCSKNIPGPSNGNNGQNWYHYSNPAVDTAFTTVDTSTDQSARLSANTQGQTALADTVGSLPVDPFPDIVVVNTNVVASTTGQFLHNFVYGPFYYANTWFLK